jgi:hypothetical protein
MIISSFFNPLLTLAVDLQRGDANCTHDMACSTGLPVVHAGHTQIHDVLQIVFGIIAALAVLMIVIAGLRFVTAQGSPQEVSKARSTIVYALVGLLLALIAESLVSLVLKNI